MPRNFVSATEAEIREWCVGYLRKTLKLPETDIDEHADFASVGLDSAESVFLVAAIEDWLGVELASNTAVEHPSVEELARFVSAELEAQSARQTKGR